MKEKLLVQHAAGDERRHELPVGCDHPIRRVVLAARRAEPRQFLDGLGPERCREPSPRLAQPRLAPHLVELQQQLGIFMRGRWPDRAAVHVHILARH